MTRPLANSGWAIFEYGWYPLLLFAATPWFLSRLGSDQYGLWMLLAATVGFGSLLSAGTGAATIKAISANNGSGGSVDVGDIVRASIALALVGGGLLAVLIVSTFWVAGDALLGRMGDPSALRLTAVAAAGMLWVEQLDQALSSALKGAERFGQAARVEIASRTLQLIAAALALLASPTLVALYSALLAVALGRLATKAVIVRTRLEVGRLRPAFHGIGGLLAFAKWGWLQGIGGIMFGVVDRMLVGSMLGAASLAYYSIASQLAVQVHAIASAGLSVIFPLVSRKTKEGVGYSLRRITRSTIAGNLVLTTAIALLLLWLGAPLLHFWLDQESATQTAIVLPWLVGAYWILAQNLVPYYVLLGLGQARLVGLTVLAAGVAALFATYFGLSAFGFAGAPLGRAAYALVSLGLIWPMVQSLSRDDCTRPTSIADIERGRSDASTP